MPRLYLTSIIALSAQYNIPMCQSVTSYLSHSERAPIQRRSGIQRFVLSHQCHQQSRMCLRLCCVENVCYVSTCQRCVPPGYSLLVREKEKAADEAIGVKKGGGVIWYFSLLSLLIVSV